MRRDMPKKRHAAGSEPIQSTVTTRTGEGAARAGKADFCSSPWTSSEQTLFPDTEAGKDFSKQVVSTELTGD